MSVLSGVLLFVLGFSLGTWVMQAYAMRKLDEMDTFYNAKLDKIKAQVDAKLGKT